MLDQIVEPLLIYLNSSQFPILISCLILGFAFLVWLFFRRNRLTPLKSDLSKAQAYIDDMPTSFNYESLQVLHVKMNKLALFNHHWPLFYNQFNQSGYISHHSPDFFFNIQTLVAPRINIRFYQTAPNLFIQIGMLFTFIGLLVALYAAGNGLISDDLAEVRTALQTLLTAATFKFSTSLSGMLAAIIFSWREKSHWYRLQLQLIQLNKSLEVFILADQPTSEDVDEKESMSSLAELLRDANTNSTSNKNSTLEATNSSVPEQITSSIIDADRELMQPEQINIAPGIVIPENYEKVLKENNTADKTIYSSKSFSSNQEMHQGKDQFNNNLILTVNLGFNSIKKEIQRLNSSFGVSTRRLYGAIHKTQDKASDNTNDSSADKQSTTSTYSASSKASSKK